MMKRTLLTWISDWWFTLLVSAVILTMLYGIGNGFNPGSWWCLYKIYKTQDGSYEVWWSCKTRQIEGTFATYEQAKAFQIKECEEFKAFMFNAPKGKRVK